MPQVVLLVVCALVCVAVANATVVDGLGDQVHNARPIVGVMAQPTYADPQYKGLGRTYLAAAYVKWLESAGARVVAVQYDLPEPQLVRLLQSINGVVFPGGELDIPGSHYQNTSQFIYNWAIKVRFHSFSSSSIAIAQRTDVTSASGRPQNEAGNYFPLWGTCQGFEQMAIMASGDDSILTEFQAENLTLALDFSSAAAHSRLYGSMEKRIVDIFRNQAVAQNLHQLGLAPDLYALTVGTDNERFRSTWDILSTNEDRRGWTFISSMESKKHPFYATQYHPERNAYEWDREEALIHSADAVAAMQALSNFLVSEARKSANTFANKSEEYASLIYNFAPLYTPRIDRYYEQVYFWK
ncbi:gammaglutamyl hydrolase, putative [Acanthamoeba castellanii str. Neff]|uniref:folate gamma-glutamyl hydrolase n=1 Tax=Acanthamoeba castellanii (strain ATCC 30010 / Neff) TaxID=1257118 RepID=L8GKY1_ACACF|nr:gammaglutamyl hydrolase, putative [Acanthamoeba castellanii str. Neff]ELR13725.1 gammaglutamyl hydrolase, putative [Acanthamoeba castellanii str. Neff]